jgi:ABC-type multidrug transport system ATPase subunit
MHITLQNIGKRYNREWIFRGVNLEFTAGKKIAITGSNGSGKSTLLQTIAGALMLSEGKIIYTTAAGEWIADNKAYEQISLAAPYLEMIEEMTTSEMLEFHRLFKKMKGNNQDILSSVGIAAAANKQIRYFSSGMKQRLKLAIAFYSKTTVLLLDEPTTNLDASGIAIYKKLLDTETDDRLVIICSNDKTEYDCCETIISIEDYKR